MLEEETPTTSLTIEEQHRILRRYNELGTLDHYQLLEVSPDADNQTIQRAYRELSRHWHPDHISCRDPGDFRIYIEKIFSSMTSAYKVLKDARQRSRYDRQLLNKLRDPDDEPPGPPLPRAPERTARFDNTAELLAYGAKLGLGKAIQEQSLKQIRARFPEQTRMLDNPAFLAGVKMALPFVGLQLAQRLRNEAHARQVHDASQGMLLVNTIDTTSEMTQQIAGQVLELGQLMLQLFGVSEHQAAEGAQQLLQDFGVAEVLNPTGTKAGVEER